MTKEIPKPECRKTLSGALAGFVLRISHSFGFRHSSFGFVKSGSWRAPSAARPCIGTMNLPGRRWERRRLAGEDAGAPRPGSWREDRGEAWAPGFMENGRFLWQARIRPASGPL